MAADNLGWRGANALRKDLTLHCLRLDMDFHKAHTPGELIERIDGDASELSNAWQSWSIPDQPPAWWNLIPSMRKDLFPRSPHGRRPRLTAWSGWKCAI